MQKPILAVGIASVVGLGIVGLIWSGVITNPIDHSHGAIAACVEKTKEQLRSPSSFKLIWSDYTARGPLTPEERKQAYESSCQGGCASGDKVIQALMHAIETRGPKLAERLRRGAKLSDIEKRVAEAWMEEAEWLKANAARVAKNLPEDQSAYVTLEYDADNGFGSAIRDFGMCRFGAIGTDGSFDKADIVMSGPVDAAAARQTKVIAERIANQ